MLAQEIGTGKDADVELLVDIFQALATGDGIIEMPERNSVSQSETMPAAHPRQ